MGSPHLMGITYNRNERPGFLVELDDQELSQVANYCAQSKGVASFTKQLTTPTRVYSITAFAQDLFLPTTFSRALTADSIWKKCLSLLVLPLVDLATLPIRLFTCISKFASSNAAPTHPLFDYLSKKALFCITFKATDHVFVTLIEKQSNTSERCKVPVNFIEVPPYPGCFECVETSHSS